MSCRASPTPRIPPREYSPLYSSAEALPRLTPGFALGKGRRLEISHHGHASNAEVLGDQQGRRPLTLQASRPVDRWRAASPGDAPPVSGPAASGYSGGPGRRSGHRAGRQECSMARHSLRSAHSREHQTLGPALRQGSARGESGRPPGWPAGGGGGGQHHRPPTLYVHHDRPVALALPGGPSIASHSPQRRDDR